MAAMRDVTIIAALRAGTRKRDDATFSQGKERRRARTPCQNPEP
jgi:hypothetical protein